MISKSIDSKGTWEHSSAHIPHRALRLPAGKSLRSPHRFSALNGRADYYTLIIKDKKEIGIMGLELATRFKFDINIDEVFHEKPGTKVCDDSLN